MMSSNTGMNVRNIVSREYSGALILNDLAVKLQERGCGRKAMETFEDAFKLIKLAPRGQQYRCRSSNDEQRRNDDLVNLKIRNAALEFSKPLQFKTKHERIPFHVVNDGSDFSSAFASQQQRSCQNDVSERYLIRFDEFNGLNCEASMNPDRDVDVDAAIILQNLGVSSLLLMNEDALPCHCAPVLRQNAIKIMQRSQAVLFKRIDQFVADGNDLFSGDSELLRRMLFAAAMATKGLVVALVTRNYFEGNNGCDNFSSSLTNCLDNLERLKRFVQDLGFFSYDATQLTADCVAPAA